ncbi:hypothetical protein K0M31_014883 [Melipona bicolor]|uniref:Uncharacterized protein n=1 Tax=Melipona bicolor TaxID=60889 RepID=A0AA40FGH6_9HYME|nr:hypothetical protein K0M31_014883 [Melipona bicolor]
MSVNMASRVFGIPTLEDEQRKVSAKFLRKLGTIFVETTVCFPVGIAYDRWQNSRKIFGSIDARIFSRNGDADADANADADADADVENSATALSIMRRVGIGANKARKFQSCPADYADRESHRVRPGDYRTRDDYRFSVRDGFVVTNEHI